MGSVIQSHTGPHLVCPHILFLQQIKGSLTCWWRPSSILFAINDAKPTGASLHAPQMIAITRINLPTPFSVGMTPDKTATNKEQIYLCTFRLYQPSFDSKTSKSPSRVDDAEKKKLSAFFHEQKLLSEGQPDRSTSLMAKWFRRELFIQHLIATLTLETLYPVRCCTDTCPAAEVFLICSVKRAAGST